MAIWRPHLSHLIGGEKLTILLAFPFRRHVWEDQWLNEPSWSRDRPEGPVVFTSFQQARDLLAEARQHGWRKRLAQLPGWSHGGWDDQFPDSWPPSAPSPNSRRSSAPAILMSPACSTTTPTSTRSRRVSPPASSPAPTAHTCAAASGSADNAASSTTGRSLPRPAKTPPTACAPCIATPPQPVQLYENHDPAHRMTRAEDEAARLDMLRVFRDAGMIVGSKRGRDFGVPVVDWSPCANEHRAGETIPPWAMVFGDAHINFATAYPHSIETGPRPIPANDFHLEG